MDDSTKFSVFNAFWIALVIAWITWDRIATPSAKRRFFPYLTWMSGAIFAAGGFWMFPSWETATIAIPLVALITFINSKVFSVCGSCGKLIHTTKLGMPKACSKCGAALS